ncbi:hypothetical protein AVEN_84772-1 [Araneus ventricosus]|uniref:Uncharacterized protein n=1 Tax=Araneus ventricosus TaxID=182803 RepID=A0A4Y2UHU7_ARAVE|nr:hypothetical protein AVEN_84772-1 [Araneus ventricosus]
MCGGGDTLGSRLAPAHSLTSPSASECTMKDSVPAIVDQKGDTKVLPDDDDPWAPSLEFNEQGPRWGGRSLTCDPCFGHASVLLAFPIASVKRTVATEIWRLVMQSRLQKKSHICSCVLIERAEIRDLSQLVVWCAGVFRTQRSREFSGSERCSIDPQTPCLPLPDRPTPICRIEKPFSTRKVLERFTERFLYSLVYIGAKYHFGGMFQITQALQNPI